MGRVKCLNVRGDECLRIRREMEGKMLRMRRKTKNRWINQKKGIRKERKLRVGKGTEQK